MNQIKLWLIVNCGVISASAHTVGRRASQKVDNVASTTYFLPIQAPIGQSDNCYTNGYVNPPHFCVLPPIDSTKFHTSVTEVNPLLAALALSTNLHPNLKNPGYNNVNHLPLNPYLALLLSHYGKYSPIYGRGRGLYGYVASNNYHNNQPIGSYKIYEDHD